MANEGNNTYIRKKLFGMPVVLSDDLDPGVLIIGTYQDPVVWVTPGVLIYHIKGQVVLVDIPTGRQSQPIDIYHLERFVVVW